MAVPGNNSEGSSAPPEITQNVQIDEDGRITLGPSVVDYNPITGRIIYKNKKYTKKRHEEKARKMGYDHCQTAHPFWSDEEYQNPQKRDPNISVADEWPEPPVHRNMPTIIRRINQTIKKMSITGGGEAGGGSAEASGSAGGNLGSNPAPGEKEKKPDMCETPAKTQGQPPAASGGGTEPITFENTVQGELLEGDKVATQGNLEENMCDEEDKKAFDFDKCLPNLMNECASNNSSSCNLQSQAQGKRRRHRRKQQYKRMAVDVPCEKKNLKKKIPTSNSSEDSGIGKRKRNILPGDGTGGTATADAILKASSSGIGVSPVPAARSSGTEPAFEQAHSSTMYSQFVEQNEWKHDADSDAVMMDCDDMEGSSDTRVAAHTHSQITEEESGESDTQNDDIESLSDHNQDADDEESDYYNNDSSTTSLSESSFTILNSSKKFVPVHSREIRSGRRRLKNTTLSTIENEELSKFLQSPVESVLKVCPTSEQERQGFLNVASLYSLSYEEGQEEQKMWVQFTKTSKTTASTQQRRNAEMIKAAAGGDRSNFSTFSEGSSLAPLFDTFVQDAVVDEGNSDECIDDRDCSVPGSSAGIGVNLLVNSKRIKKGC